jgi:hypothetical protein
MNLNEKLIKNKDEETSKSNSSREKQKDKLKEEF